MAEQHPPTTPRISTTISDELDTVCVASGVQLHPTDVANAPEEVRGSGGQAIVFVRERTTTPRGGI
jgi:hypothetical protein